MGFSEEKFGTAINPPAGYEKFFITIRKIDSVTYGGVMHQYSCFSEEKAKLLQRDWEKGQLNFSQGPYFIQECLANSELRIDISDPYNNFPYASVYQSRSMSVFITHIAADRFWILRNGRFTWSYSAYNNVYLSVGRCSLVK
jgi:hypothetical protein